MEFSALLIRCPESTNLAPQITDLFSRNRVRVSKYVQYNDAGMNFIRVEWVANTGWQDKKALINELSRELEADSGLHDTDFTVRLGSEIPNVGLFCSTQTHVLAELLNRSFAAKEPQINVPFVISDDERAGNMADQFGVPFFLLSSSQSADQILRRQLEIIRRYKPDLIGLARYDALLSQAVLDAAGCPVVAVQNSFLPSVKSEKAYSLAYQQGLKLIGATARIVEAKAIGPIIEQDMVKLGPGLSEHDIGLLGQTVERKVFATAVRKLVEHKVMVYNAKTIVFD